MTGTDKFAGAKGAINAPKRRFVTLAESSTALSEIPAYLVVSCSDSEGATITIEDVNAAASTLTFGLGTVEVRLRPSKITNIDAGVVVVACYE